MSDVKNIAAKLATIEPIAGSGYALALHIRYTTPTILLQTYDKVWTDHYSQNSFVMMDPTVAWGFTHTGAQRWSDLADGDGVLADAARFGLKFGVVCAVEQGDSRSMGSFARAESEFADAEIDTCMDVLKDLHALTANTKAMSAEAIAKLSKMSVKVVNSTG